MPLVGILMACNWMLDMVAEPQLRVLLIEMEKSGQRDRGKGGNRKSPSQKRKSEAQGSGSNLCGVVSLAVAAMLFYVGVRNPQTRNARKGDAFDLHLELLPQVAEENKSDVSAALLRIGGEQLRAIENEEKSIPKSTPLSNRSKEKTKAYS